MKIKDILIQILLILWQLPQCLVGLVMLPFLGKLRLVRYENYCWAFEGEKQLRKGNAGKCTESEKIKQQYI